MKRHPELAKRKDQNMNQALMQMLNKFNVGDYFQKVGEVLDSKFKKPTYKDL